MQTVTEAPLTPAQKAANAEYIKLEQEYESLFCSDVCLTEQWDLADIRRKLGNMKDPERGQALFLLELIKDQVKSNSAKIKRRQTKIFKLQEKLVSERGAQPPKED
ncbi:MAG: hypothetical protein AAF636_11390 [Pseudomonadota bacterium]